MKNILIIISLIIFLSCNETNIEKTNQELKKIEINEKYVVDGYDIYILNFNNHEYIMATNGIHYGGGTSIIHSESCKCLINK